MNTIQQKFSENTHTGRSLTAKQNALKAILHQTKTSFDDWLLEFFEFGYQLSFHLFPFEELREKHTHNKEYNYWSWAMTLYVNDDVALLDAVELNKMTWSSYLQEKQRLFHELTKQCE